MRYAAVITLLIIAYVTATDIYTPSMPEIARHFNESSDEVQKTISYFLLGAVLSCVFTGTFADIYGKKKFMLGGLALAGLGSIITIYSPSLEWLIAGRFIQGFGAAAAPVIGFAAIADLYPADKVARIYALLGMILAAVPAIAPFIGGIISTHFGWPVIFMCILILFVVSFFCTWLILPASLDKTTPTSASEVLKSYKSFLTSKAFLALALLCPIYNSVEWFYLTFLPFYMQDQIGISPEYYGIAIGVLIGWFAIGSYVGGKLITAYGNHNTIVFALTSGLISGLMLWVTVLFFPLSVLAICIPLSLFLLAFGMLFPSSVSSALSVFKENRTRASSIRSLFGTSFAYIGSFSAEWVSETNLAGFALYLSMCSLIAIAVYHMRARAEQVSI